LAQSADQNPSLLTMRRRCDIVGCHSQAFPGRDAACNAALLIRDRSTLSARNDPGSAAHHFMARRAREMRQEEYRVSQI
jgi:hypothetical protein